MNKEIDFFKEDELLGLLESTEDHFVERKSFNDLKDARKTIVAFANSAPIGCAAVMFVGVRNNGEVEEKRSDLDSVQKSLTKTLKEVYPPVFYVPKRLTKEGRDFLAVIVPGSPERPHFAGQSYVRVGSESREATEREFSHLIAERNSKVYYLRQWVDKTATLTVLGSRNSQAVTLVDCNQFFLTWREHGGRMASTPVERIQISFDHVNDRIRIYLTDAR